MRRLRTRHPQQLGVVLKETRCDRNVYLGWGRCELSALRAASTQLCRLLRHIDRRIDKLEIPKAKKA
ncbi:hypothetical protein LCGC14_1414660 [marine sediment metagenome]|uniref:Uncharacterized protein n=1 Tax=marine sediment metagenome TaxID=412755 RepID=A0A0F9MUY2_9ZZZZ